MRCASPPESVSAGRSSVRYGRPTSSRNCSRGMISFITLAAMAASRALNCQRDSDGIGRDLADGAVEHAHGAGARVQPRAAAARAGALAEQAGERLGGLL